MRNMRLRRSDLREIVIRIDCCYGPQGIHEGDWTIHLPRLECALSEFATDRSKL